MACETCGGKASVRPISEQSFDMGTTAQLTVTRQLVTPMTVTIPAAIAVDNGVPRSFIVNEQTFDLPIPVAQWLKANYPGLYRLEIFNVIEIEPVEIYNPPMEFNPDTDIDPTEEMFDDKQSEPVVTVVDEPVEEMFVNEQSEPVKSAVQVTVKKGKVK